MQIQHDIPDDAHRSALEDLLDGLKKANTALPKDASAAPPEACEEVGDGRESIETAIDIINEELQDIPEWDTELVRDVTLAAIGGTDTNVRRVDSSLVMEWEVGTFTDTTGVRYETTIAGDSEWFLVKRDGDWEEVWTN